MVPVQRVLCPGVSLSRGSQSEDSLSGVFYPGGLCLRGSLNSSCLSMGISVQESLSRGVSVQEMVSVLEDLCLGVSVQEGSVSRGC